MSKIKIVLNDDNLKLYNIDSFFISKKKYFSINIQNYINLFYNKKENEKEEDIVYILFKNGEYLLLPLNEIKLFHIVKNNKVIILKNNKIKQFLLIEEFNINLN